MSKFEAGSSINASSALATETSDDKPTTLLLTRKTGRGGGLLGLVLAATLWGTVGVTSGLLNRIQPTPAFTIGFLRLAFASPFLLALASFTARSNPFHLKRHEWVLVSLMGLTTAGYQLCYFTAIPLSSVTLVVVVALCSSPLIVALLSIPVFGEHLTWRLGGALLLALAGTGLLAVGSSQGEFFKPAYLWGAVLALGAGFSYSGFAVLSKLTTQRSEMGAAQAMSVAFTLGALLLLPMALFSGSFQLDLAGGVWLCAAYLGIVPTGLAYIIYMRALRRATATTAAITTLLEPAVAALLSWLLLGETLTLNSLLGAGLLITSVFVISRQPSAR